MERDNSVVKPMTREKEFVKNLGSSRAE